MENFNTQLLKDYIIQVFSKLISKLPEEYCSFIFMNKRIKMTVSSIEVQDNIDESVF